MADFLRDIEVQTADSNKRGSDIVAYYTMWSPYNAKEMDVNRQHNMLNISKYGYFLL